MATEGGPWLVDVCVPAEVAAMEGGGASQLVTVEAPDGM
jgi:hypothetical protein